MRADDETVKGALNHDWIGEHLSGGLLFRGKKLPLLDILMVCIRRFNKRAELLGQGYSAQLNLINTVDNIGLCHYSHSCHGWFLAWVRGVQYGEFRLGEVMMGSQKIKIRVNAFFGDEEIELSFPENWAIQECRMAGHDKSPLSDEEMRHALQKPLGHPTAQGDGQRGQPSVHSLR